MSKFLKATILALCLFTICPAQESKNNCDFTIYKPLRMSHALLNAAVTKIQPKYPAAALLVKANGLVSVRILVDRKGNVVQACVESGHPLLRASAKKAALEWKFKENFGFSKKSIFPKKWRLIQSYIIFDFKP